MVLQFICFDNFNTQLTLIYLDRIDTLNLRTHKDSCKIILIKPTSIYNKNGERSEKNIKFFGFKSLSTHGLFTRERD